MLTLIVANLLCAAGLAVAQDRAALRQEIVDLVRQYNTTTDANRRAEIIQQLEVKEPAFLAPAAQDFTAYAEFLKQPDTGLVRLMPRETSEGVFFTPGGGAYYSFTRLTHVYGFGSDLSLQFNFFRTGFAGADFGFLVSLGNTPIDSVTATHPGVAYLTNYAPPRRETEARDEFRRADSGFMTNNFVYRSTQATALNTTYALRAITYGAGDSLVVFRAVRRDTDDSLILVWKMVRWYATPQLERDPFASVSAASYARGVYAPGSIVAAYGVDISRTTEIAQTTPLPTRLGSASAGWQFSLRKIDNTGRTANAPLFAVAPGQMNLLVPENATLGPAILTVFRFDGIRYNENVRIEAVAPALFSANADGRDVAAAVALRVRNGVQTYETVATYDNVQKRFVSVPIDLGPEGDQVFLLLFGTGVRGRSALDKVTVKVGGVDAPVGYAGAQGLVGLDQINVELPRSLVGKGEVDVLLTADGKIANTVRVNIK
ncbi:MAG: hypothetical protein SF339_20510 [Blastocatellia bacterium]|nr:hypothetical protein [Blastocatellia bacterium]